MYARLLSHIAVTGCIVAVVAAACGGGRNGEEPFEPPAVARAVAVRQIENGVALLKTVIEVEFDAAVYNGKRDAPAFEYVTIDIPSASASDGIETVSASEVRVDGEMVFVTVPRPVPQDSVLHIEGGLFGHTDAPPIQVDVASTLSTFQATLAGNALQPTSPDVVTAGDPPAVTTGDRDTETLRRIMVDHLIGRGTTESIVGRAVGIYDAIDPEIVPSPKIRAALGALAGSFAEPAVEYLFSDVSCTGTPVTLVDFREIPQGGTLLARVIFDDNGDRIVLLKPSLEGERFELLMPLLAHEAIHCDQVDTIEEETAASAFDILLYAQLLTIDPSLALEGTPLSRALNLDLIAMINSGRRYPESLGILASDGVTQALPGTNSPLRSFAEVIANAYDLPPSDSPAPELLADVYASILAEQSGFQAGQPFDLVYLDQLIAQQMEPQALAALVIALTLQP